MNKKLNWGYVRFWLFVLSLLLTSAQSYAFERPQHKLYFHLDGGSLGLSEISLSSNDLDDDKEELSVGVSYDYVDERGHSFALEIHPTSSIYEGERYEGNIIYIGYRYHTNSGLYMGLGYGGGDTEVQLNTCENYLGDIINECTISYSSGGVVLSLGYTYVFKSGFTLGVSSLYAPPSRARKVVEVGSGFRSERGISGSNLDISAYNVGLVLGYTWR